MDKESLRLLLAQGESVERIGKRFGRHPSTVGYWMKKHGLEAPLRAKHAAKGGIEQELLETLVARQLTIAEIADEVELSKTTVRHWLRRYGLHTHATDRARSAQQARHGGKLMLTLACPRHGTTGFVLEGRGYYRCRLCRQHRVAQRRRDVKALLVAEAGGRCAVCGYDRCLAALAFHHLDPSMKRLHLSADGHGIAIERLRAEATKCLLLCANCHAEVENGLTAVPLRCAG